MRITPLQHQNHQVVPQPLGQHKRDIEKMDNTKSLDDRISVIMPE